MYFITAMMDIKLDKFGFPKMDTRCFGYVETEKEAREIVENNIGDIWETIYAIAVIEKIPSGLHATPEEIEWYLFDVEKSVYRIAKRPEKLEHFSNFSQVG